MFKGVYRVCGVKVLDFIRAHLVPLEEIYFDLCDTCFKSLSKLIRKYWLQYHCTLYTFKVWNRVRPLRVVRNLAFLKGKKVMMMKNCFVGTWAMRMQNSNLAPWDVHVCNIGCGILVTYNSFFGLLRSWKWSWIVVLPIFHLLQVRMDWTLRIFRQSWDLVQLSPKCWPLIVLDVCVK